MFLILLFFSFIDARALGIKVLTKSSDGGEVEIYYETGKLIKNDDEYFVVDESTEEVLAYEGKDRNFIDVTSNERILRMANNINNLPTIEIEDISLKPKIYFDDTITKLLQMILMFGISYIVVNLVFNIFY